MNEGLEIEHQGDPERGAMKRRSKADLPRLMIKDALKLLTNPQFCEAVKKIHEEAAAIRAAGVATGEAQGGLIELGERFRVTWGVLPPPAVLLVDPDPRRRVVEAIGSGRWGLILVFPWTTDAEIQAQSKNIRKVVRKRHRDAQEDHRAQCAEWLEGSGYSRPQVAKAVWGRDRGLRRPTTAEVIEEVSEDQEREWIEKAMARGLSYEQAAQQYRQHRRKIQGSEAPASAMVRMAEARETARVDKLNEDLATPVTSEPLSAAITRLVQALHDQESDSQVREKARAVHRALIPSASL